MGNQQQSYRRESQHFNIGFLSWNSSPLQYPVCGLPTCRFENTINVGNSDMCFLDISMAQLVDSSRSQPDVAYQTSQYSKALRVWVLSFLTPAVDTSRSEG